MRTITYGLALAALVSLKLSAAELVDVVAQVPSIQTEIRYFTADNFVGKKIDGYLAPKCLLSKEAVKAVTKAQYALNEFGLGLKVFDCYRPQMAVDHFVRWAKDLEDTKNKAKYYPEVPKNELFKRGYIAARSGHSRGSTLDVTLVDLVTGVELDMGSGWDFFSKVSWPSYQGISAQQRANRKLLAKVMRSAGFIGLTEEWWHFTLIDEPYADQYFTLPVK
ncbi:MULTISPECIES: M15 family metallopeptidase [Pseudoalteromonas]|uniref:D-alanyl-D-alanine dipeptidase n=1 Tax=Pseudoalteromonas obscura TaxID=3048491 RepID=A0ABT7ELW2_9GAMM|nr:MULTISPECIES: M15 family metallopeptidase [Pseudoalteromonas]MBQ4838045.1 M15 family metallopeptidase [Pseudoalteromonas luteoviolacea]MDK2596013.1 M15 family metallopeptidase [Pseudoalteromonas sp. P94(2023)]